jgi:hypothetical protein
LSVKPYVIQVIHGFFYLVLQSHGRDLHPMKKEKLLQQDANMVSGYTACCPEHGEGPNFAAQNLMICPGAGRLMDKRHEGG